MFNDWTRAIPHLKLATGSYCHFCEMKVTNALAIEHIKPQTHFPRLQNQWENFLLICNYCNSEKLAMIPKNYRTDYFWPHLNNTLLAFDFNFTANVIPNTKLTNPVDIDRANRLIALYGLDKRTSSDGSPDPRWVERAKALYLAINRKSEYLSGRATLDAIVDFAVATGFFSVWLKIFDNIPVVRAALINCPDFKIPINECFDAALMPMRNSENDL